jgi:hypothetical protein
LIRCSRCRAPTSSCSPPKTDAAGGAARYRARLSTRPRASPGTSRVLRKRLPRHARRDEPRICRACGCRRRLAPAHAGIKFSMRPGGGRMRSLPRRTPDQPQRTRREAADVVRTLAAPARTGMNPSGSILIAASPISGSCPGAHAFRSLHNCAITGLPPLDWRGASTSHQTRGRRPGCSVTNSDSNCSRCTIHK